MMRTWDQPLLAAPPWHEPNPGLAKHPPPSLPNTAEAASVLHSQQRRGPGTQGPFPRGLQRPTGTWGPTAAACPWAPGCPCAPWIRAAALKALLQQRITSQMWQDHRYKPGGTSARNLAAGRAGIHILFAQEGVETCPPAVSALYPHLNGQGWTPAC